MSEYTIVDIRDMWDIDEIEKGGIHDKFWSPEHSFWLLKLFKPGTGRTLGRCYTLQISAGKTYGFWEQCDKKSAEACYEDLKESLPLDIGKNRVEFEAVALDIIKRHLS